MSDNDDYGLVEEVVPVSDEAAEHELVMRFVVVTGEGGPYDDDGYAAGWEMGQLDTFLATTRPPFHAQPILADNAKQADLIGMKYRYKVTVQVMEDNPDWSWLELELDDSDTADTAKAPVVARRPRQLGFRVVVILLALYLWASATHDFAVTGGTPAGWFNMIMASVALPGVCYEAVRITRREEP